MKSKFYIYALITFVAFLIIGIRGYQNAHKIQNLYQEHVEQMETKMVKAEAIKANMVSIWKLIRPIGLFDMDPTKIANNDEIDKRQDENLLLIDSLISNHNIPDEVALLRRIRVAAINNAKAKDIQLQLGKYGKDSVLKYSIIVHRPTYFKLSDAINDYHSLLDMKHKLFESEFNQSIKKFNQTSTIIMLVFVILVFFIGWVLYSGYRELENQKKKIEHNNFFVSGIIDSLLSRIIVIDRKGNIISVNNHSAFNDFAPSIMRERLNTGMNIFQVFEELNLRENEDSVTICDKIKQNIESNVKQDKLEFEFKEKNRQFWLAIRITRFEVDKTYYVLSVSDITINRSEEEDLKKSHEELENLNKELDRFSYIVAHDLRSPLGTILNLINVVEDEEDINELKSFMQMIKTSAIKMNEFILDTLTYSQNARTPVVTENIHWKNLIDEVVGTNVNSKSAIRIVEDISVSGIFSSDKNRIEIILNNLVGNAIKYHKKDSEDRWIKIKLTGNNESCTIEVSDNGQGIKAEALPKIFDMFFRATTSAPGTGLGLHILKEAVQKISGNVEVESELDKGTKFTVTLPNLAIS